tara:strand:+ start:6224 stop:6799 length:576 start_codon:yes stop_codon:yes gene_type:complete
MPEYTLADIFAEPGETPRTPRETFELAVQSQGAPGVDFQGMLPPGQGYENLGQQENARGGFDAVNLDGAFDANGVPTEELMSRIRFVESGGNDRAVSPVGAEGPYQIMPLTGGQPGYGVPPISRDDVWDPTKSRAWASQYLAAMHRKYENPMLAIAAYNAGPGTIDKAVRNGGFSAFPAETRGYVQKVSNY